MLTNSGDLVESVSAAGRLGKSDHTMLLVQLYGGQPQEKGPPQRLDWNRANWDGMREDLSGINWHNQLNGLETEAAWIYVKSTLHSLTSKYVPLKKTRPPNKPIWMNREISRAMARKRRLWRRRAPAEEYKEAEKKVRNLVRNAKRNFEKKTGQQPW